jgi:hypothetical protein
MTIQSRAAKTPDKTSNRAIYHRAFVRKVHRVLSLGYQRLCSSGGSGVLVAKEEPAITGLLVEAMRAVKNQVDWRLDIDDDPPINDHSKKEGRNRPRIDIQVRRLSSGHEPRFHFEAKRLHDDGSLSRYLGDDGLKSLLSGYYAKGDGDAGMLGYVQKEPPLAWAERVRGRLETDRDRYNLAPTGQCWKKHAEPGLDLSFASAHPRSKQPITVHHTFLLCH